MISILKTDFYKATHMQQYNPEITHFTSYLTPRGSRFETIDEMVVFGIANFVNEYLFKDFNKNFFNEKEEKIVNDIYEVLHNGLGYDTDAIKITEEKILSLHKLGYLPIELNGLPEGTLCPMQVPAIEIRSTNEQFAWVAQSIESLLSCEIWHPIMSATIAYKYKEIAKEAYDKTVDDNISHMTAMCDFSMRGQESYHSAIASGAGFLTSFYNCSTIEAREYIKENYNDNNPIKVNGLTSTEHSVMCSDYSITNDEREIYRRLLTEVYPNTSFAAVCDSYDFWNIVVNILPSLRKEIEAHNGFLGIRHDSDCPIHALCGIEQFDLTEIFKYADIDCIETEKDFESLIYEFINDFLPKRVDTSEVYFQFNGTPHDDIKFSGIYKIIPVVFVVNGEEEYGYEIKKLRNEMTYEDKGMVESLYELFGGTVNSKGYKVMNSKLKAIYGDSITIPRAKEIYRRLEKKGFAANNVSLGVGSFSMQCLEENGELKPFTRDSFSIAIKATYCKYKDSELMIFKNPKNCSSKKSLKGLCRVIQRDNRIVAFDELNEQAYNEMKDNSLFINYFKDGVVNKYSFEDIRKRIEEHCYI